MLYNTQFNKQSVITTPDMIDIKKRERERNLKRRPTRELPRPKGRKWTYMIRQYHTYLSLCKIPSP